MIKRTNKIASVLVTIAIISLAGPIQANAETYPRIPLGEGTIYEAVAYKGGKFYIDGKTVSFFALQKISKEQAEDQIDGANYAKTTVT